MLEYKGPGWYSLFFDDNRNLQVCFWSKWGDGVAISGGELYQVKNPTDFWEAVILEIQKEFQIF